MNYINLNGKICPKEDTAPAADNGAFRYGYGLFETMLLLDGNIRLGQYHWERLFAGMQQLHFAVPPLFTPAHLEAEVMRTVKKNKAEKLCRVRLQVFAGGGGLYGTDLKPQYLIECFTLEDSTLLLNDNGLTMGIAAGLAKSPDQLANLKSCNALIYAIAARMARQHQWNDALIANTAGSIIESTIANIFWIKDEQIFTPPLAAGCVAGVMRRHIIGRNAGITEKTLLLPELLQADEVFLTNAIKGIRWVGSIAGSRYHQQQIGYIYRSLF